MSVIVASKRLPAQRSTVFAPAPLAAKVNARNWRMGLGMKRLAVLAAAWAVVMGLGSTEMADRAEAMGFCNCCDSSLTQPCGKVCAVVSLKAGMCPAIVDYDGTGATTRGANPLNGISLREVVLGQPRPSQLEKFRRFMEKGRRQSVSSHKKAMRQLRRHRISNADFTKAENLYKEALVNYYHGIRAYLNRVGTKSD
jgi:hypothetical protein